ncbi:hypothetical protein [Candidatus Darwinibacter acetoxidans]
MNKREKKLFLVILILLAVIMFMSNSFRKKNDTIDFNNNLINRYKNDIKSYNIKIDSLNAVLLAKKTDTVIKIRYKQKIDSIYVYKYDDYISFYDTLLHTNLLKSDTFICFDSINIQKLTTKIVKCERDSELLANCYVENNLYNNIIKNQDSVILLQDSINTTLQTNCDKKVKKLKKQRNTAIGVAFTELLLIIGILAK